MGLQVIKDGHGHDMGIFIPMNEWDRIVQKHEDLKELVQSEPKKNGILTQKQEEMARQTLKEMDENPDSLLDWDDVQHQIDWDAC